MEDFSNLKDEEIIALIRQGNDDAMEYLLNKYKEVVRINAKSMFLVGGDNDDLIQEGMIGLYKAITSYKDDKGALFSSFASLCIKRRIYTAIEASNKNKHIPLNSYVSFSGLQDEYPSDIRVKNEKSPEELIIDKEKENMIEYNLERSLSKLELEVLSLHLQGLTYIEIADKLDKSAKSIDNALTRIKSKANEIVARLNNE